MPLRHLLHLLVTSVVITEANGQILLQNGLENWAFGLPDGLVGLHTTLAHDSIVEVSEPVHGGSKAMRLQLGSDGGALLTTGPLSVAANELYEVRFWMRGRARVGAGLYDGRPENGGFATATPGVEANDSTWRYVLHTVLAANSTSAAEFVFVLEPAGDSSQVVIDDITINVSALPDPLAATIAEIQTSTAINGSSPLNFEFVRTQGIITGLAPSSFFIQDGSGPWNGIEVLAAPQPDWALGDAILLFGTVDEESIPNDPWFRSRTRLIAVPFVQVTSTGNPVPEPVEVSAWDLEDEEWESVLVQVRDLECVGEPDPLTNEWPAANWQGATRVDDLLHYFAPTLGSVYTITGIDHFTGAAKLLPRSDQDFSPGVGILEVHTPVLQLSPNPTSSTVRISNNAIGDEAHVRISDGAGRVVLETTSAQALIELDLSGSPNGIYHVSLTGQGRTLSAPLVVLR